ncbi:MAG: hypothetical protein IPN53_01565 [Comamonadaceae bacterium]|nr:hypothetical protein [Comamonadaceae bacterium]
MSENSPLIGHCRSAGRFRALIRNRLLLAGWRAKDLPLSPTMATTSASFQALVGPAIQQHMTQALFQADLLAGQIGGCARDAYTVLYACASFAVLFAASGVVVSDHGVMIYLLGLAELSMLLILLMTFRNAHQVNVHQRWLGLRFHAEFLRCVPLLAALPVESTTSKGQLHQKHARGQHGDVPHLKALSGKHKQINDKNLQLHEQAQQVLSSQLIEQLREVYLRDPLAYTQRCMVHANLLAKQQLHYYCLKAQQEQAIVGRSHWLSMVAFGLTLVAVLTHFFIHSPLLTVINTVVPAFVASLHGFLAQEESERLAASNRQMAIRIHQWISTDVGAPNDSDATRAHLADLVDLMMSEVQDWHRLFGEKGMYHLG